MEFPNSALAKFPREVDIPLDKMNTSKIYLYDDTISSANYIALSTNPTAKTGELHKLFAEKLEPKKPIEKPEKITKIVKILDNELHTQFFVGSMTVIGLYIFYRMLIKSH
jgi:hypothetical protein